MVKKINIMACLGIALFLLCYPPTNVFSKTCQEYEQQGQLIFDLPVTEKVIALTFDDGPHAVYTPQILDLLAAYDAKATFFVIGSRMKRYSDIIHRQVAEGHEHANHTYTHKRFRALSKDDIQQEIRQMANEYKALTGKDVTLFRPPGGHYNDKVVNVAIEEGYQVVMWSWHQDSRDWSKPGVSKIIENVLSNTRPGDIVLFHDSGGNRKQTVEALKVILPALKEAGYRMVTVSELLFMNQVGSLDLQ